MSGDDLEFEDPDPDPESGAHPLRDVDVPITVAAPDEEGPAKVSAKAPTEVSAEASASAIPERADAAESGATPETAPADRDSVEAAPDPDLEDDELSSATTTVAAAAVASRVDAKSLSLPFPTFDELSAPVPEPERRNRRRTDTTTVEPIGRAAIAPASDEDGSPHLIAIASGRGGAGKSLLAANVAVYLAQIGKRVVTVDADPAGGSLHHMLGAPGPARGFASFLRGHVSLEELAVDTPVSGVRLIAGEPQPFGAPRPKMAAKTVLSAFRALGADTVVVDLGGADLPLCIDLWLGADTAIVMTLSDPPSIEATYRFVKSAFLRRVRGERGLDKLLGQLGRPLPSALDLYRAALDNGRTDRDAIDEGASAADPTTTSRSSAELAPSRSSAAKASTLAAALGEAMSAYRPRFVVSQTRSLGDTRLGPQMALAAHRRLGHRLEYLGHMEADETVTAAARRHRPVMAEFPEAKICKNIERIVRRILSSETERPAAAAPPRLEEDQTFYEILETQPGVSDEEVRRAYRVMKEIYAGGSPAVFGLYDDTELAALHARANAAHDTLFAPERRRLYDLSLPEADLARAVRRTAQSPSASDAAGAGPGASARPPVVASAGAPALDDGAEITGALLKKIREARGFELSEIAQRTKISERYLRSIEDERFDELPAAVYVRGFVAQVARLLRIDATRASEGFLRRFHGANGPSAGTPTLKEL